MQSPSISPRSTISPRSNSPVPPPIQEDSITSLDTAAGHSASQIVRSPADVEGILLGAEAPRKECHHPLPLLKSVHSRSILEVSEPMLVMGVSNKSKPENLSRFADYKESYFLDSDMDFSITTTDNERFIQTDFNDLKQLQKLTIEYKHRFKTITLDHRVMHFAQWKPEHITVFKELLTDKGELLLPIENHYQSPTMRGGNILIFDFSPDRVRQPYNLRSYFGRSIEQEELFRIQDTPVVFINNIPRFAIRGFEHFSPSFLGMLNDHIQSGFDYPNQPDMRGRTLNELSVDELGNLTTGMFFKNNILEQNKKLVESVFHCEGDTVELTRDVALFQGYERFKPYARAADHRHLDEDQKVYYIRAVVHRT